MGLLVEAGQARRSNMSAASSSVLLLQKATNKRQKQMLKDAFKKADKNGDGKLSYEEYWNVIKMSGISISEAEFQEIVKVKDADSDGFISCKEFLERSEGSSKKSDIAFDILDKDGDGYLTKEEFSQAGGRITRKQIEAVYKRNDQDGDGRLSRDEYNSLVNKRT